MPKSDTWPGGADVETATGMDSAGSCDSVVSVNSAFSDDSLEYLSAEEKACLMFLEETIESLDTEEDSGLSNDELEHPTKPGTTQMRRSGVNGFHMHHSMDPIKEHVDNKPKLSYLVPTPFVQANGSACPVSRPKVGFLLEKNTSTKPNPAPLINKAIPQQPKPEVPLEVNVLIQPPTKTKDLSFRTAEGALPRGPLSYDALVHLQRSASTKKTPLCPSVDHTIDSYKPPPVVMESRRYGRFDRTNTDSSKSAAPPPVVPPKPKTIPQTVQEKTQEEVKLTSRPSFYLKKASDPNTVRREALQKLGLLKDDHSPAPLPQTSCSYLDPTNNKYTKVPSNLNPSRSPSFCASQEPKTRLLQSSASFHHASRNEMLSNSGLNNRQKASSLEQPTAQYDGTDGKTSCSKTTLAPQTPAQKPTNAVGYSVMIVPGMGADRKEALRKLGLLKE
ncbi:specifically androgen-regulated gene protein isoform 2-T3 [Synchiropus picturatus]